MHPLRTLSSIVILAALAACDTPSLTKELPQPPTQWLEKSGAHNTPSSSAATTPWWKAFHDPALDGLIETALKDSPDIRVAVAKIAEARGQETTAHGALMPEVNGVGAADRQRTQFFAPITGSDYSAKFDASYELDLFGKNRSAYSASQALVHASEHDYAWTKLSLAAEVARVYIAMRTQEKQMALATKNAATQKETFALTQKLYKAGGSSEFDVERAALEISQTDARVQEYRRQREAYFLSLVTLTGLQPHALQQRLATSGNITGLDLAALADSPAQVLSRRPDIAAANLRLQQATALKESQAAALFPDISIGSMFGISKTVLVNAGNVWSLTANLTTPILDFGRIQGQIDAASAREVQAFEVWRKSILQAVQDVETSLSDAARLHDQRITLEQAKQHASKAWQLANQRYRAGDSSLIDVLDAQRQLITADSALVDAEGNYVTSIIALHKAVGQ